jgi:hypothetical protein
MFVTKELNKAIADFEHLEPTKKLEAANLKTSIIQVVSEMDTFQKSCAKQTSLCASPAACNPPLHITPPASRTPHTVHMHCQHASHEH